MHARQRDCLVLSDEVYGQFTYDGVGHVSLASPDLMEGARVVVVESFSKTYGMTGWRVGNVVCSDSRLADRIATIQMCCCSAPCTVSQHAALAALESYSSYVEVTRVKYADRMCLMTQALEQILALSVAYPGGVLYCFI